MQIQINLNKKDSTALQQHQTSKSPMFPEIKKARIYQNGPGIINYYYIRIKYNVITN